MECNIFVIIRRDDFTFRFDRSSQHADYSEFKMLAVDCSSALSPALSLTCGTSQLLYYMDICKLGID